MKTKNIIILLAGCLVLALIASFIASSYPDGLEKVTETLGFAGAAGGKPFFQSPMPDYAVAAIKNPVVSSILAATIGIVVTFFIIYIVGKIVSRGGGVGGNSVRRLN